MHRACATHVIEGGSDAIERDSCECGVSTGGIIDSDASSENNDDNNSSDDDGDNGSDSPLRLVVKHCNELTVVERGLFAFLMLQTL